MSHTPGPWRISSNEWSGDDEIIGANDKHVVCFGHGYGDCGGLESDDDARLIAAAPELLAALKETVTVIYSFHGEAGWKLYQSSPEMKLITTTIAKAEGQ